MSRRIDDVNAAVVETLLEFMSFSPHSLRFLRARVFQSVKEFSEPPEFSHWIIYLIFYSIVYPAETIPLFAATTVHWFFFLLVPYYSTIRVFKFFFLLSYSPTALGGLQQHYLPPVVHNNGCHMRILLIFLSSPKTDGAAAAAYRPDLNRIIR